MTDFTPIASSVGGALIGVSASLLLLCNGRIAGISGIVGGIVRPAGDGVAWRVAFLAGLFLGGITLAQLAPDTLAIELERSPAALILAGLLVGFGTRLGNGCTSGHGVCGISRFSQRSLIATGTFMGVAAFTVFCVSKLLGGVL